MLSRVSAADPAQANLCFSLERVYMQTDHMWLKAQRGELNEDPVTFAIRDRLSDAVGAAALAIAAGILGIGS